MRGKPEDKHGRMFTDLVSMLLLFDYWSINSYT